MSAYRDGPPPNASTPLKRWKRWFVCRWRGHDMKLLRLGVFNQYPPEPFTEPCECCDTYCARCGQAWMKATKAEYDRNRGLVALVRAHDIASERKMRPSPGSGHTGLG